MPQTAPTLDSTGSSHQIVHESLVRAASEVMHAAALTAAKHDRLARIRQALVELQTVESLLSAPPRS